MPHLWFEVVLGRQRPLASELQRRTAFEVSFVAKHQRRTASELQRRNVSELQRRTVSEEYCYSRAPTPNCIRAPAPDCIRAPTPDYVQAPMPDYIRGVIDHLGSKKLKEFMPEMPSMEPSIGARALCRTASEVVHHPNYGPIFC